jgi:hypothetical protein
MERKKFGSILERMRDGVTGKTFYYGDLLVFGLTS